MLVMNNWIPKPLVQIDLEVKFILNKLIVKNNVLLNNNI